VAERGGQVVGWAKIDHPTELPASEHVWHCNGFAVDPGSQGQGIGRALLDGMVAEARRRFPALRFEVADLRALPAAGDWSLVVAWYSLVHLAGSELPEAISALAAALRPGGTLALAVHLGAEVVHRDEWFDHPVDVDFTLHDQAELLAAVRAADLNDVEWYVRSARGREAETARCYVVARRPA